jgi:hypothetical protein
MGPGMLPYATLIPIDFISFINMYILSLLYFFDTCKKARAQEKSENIKFISSMVREADRIDLLFPEVSMVSTFHRSADEWIDRATIAVRSKISLSELESLVESGEQMPVNVSDLLEKLKPRLEQARDWIDRFQSMVPCPFIEKSDEDTDADTDGPVVDNLTWMSRMRIALRNSHENTLLVNIATEASGIPVEIDCLKLFQIELDAKNWSLRTAKWLPVDGEGDDSSAPDASGKKGKIDMLREHLEKAEAIREKLPMTPDEQVSWSLEYETELTAIVESADEWFEKVRKACRILGAALVSSWWETFCLSACAFISYILLS